MFALLPDSVAMLSVSLEVGGLSAWPNILQLAHPMWQSSLLLWLVVFSHAIVLVLYYLVVRLRWNNWLILRIQKPPNWGLTVGNWPQKSHPIQRTKKHEGFLPPERARVNGEYAKQSNTRRNGLTCSDSSKKPLPKLRDSPSGFGARSSNQGKVVSEDL